MRAELERAGLGDLVAVDSAGIGDWHAGEGMDHRAHAELDRRGYPRSRHRARQIGVSWLDRRDLILAMDQQNLRALRRMAAGQADLLGRMWLFRTFDPASPPGAEVPDPYLGDGQAFEHVLDLIEAAAKGLAVRLAEVLIRRAPGTLAN